MATPQKNLGPDFQHFPKMGFACFGMPPKNFDKIFKISQKVFLDFWATPPIFLKIFGHAPQKKIDKIFKISQNVFLPN